jgi:hypothetical protein
MGESQFLRKSHKHGFLATGGCGLYLCKWNGQLINFMIDQLYSTFYLLWLTKISLQHYFPCCVSFAKYVNSLNLKHLKNVKPGLTPLQPRSVLLSR